MKTIADQIDFEHHYFRVLLNECRRRRHQHSFHAWLLLCCAQTRQKIQAILAEQKQLLDLPPKQPSLF